MSTWWGQFWFNGGPPFPFHSTPHSCIQRIHWKIFSNNSWIACQFFVYIYSLMITLNVWCSQFKWYKRTDLVPFWLNQQDCSNGDPLDQSSFIMGRLCAFYRCSNCKNEWSMTTERAPGIEHCRFCTSRSYPYSVVIRSSLSFFVWVNLKSEHLFVLPSNETIAMEPLHLKQNIAVRDAVTNGTADRKSQMSLFSASDAKCLQNRTQRYERFRNDIIELEWFCTTESVWHFWWLFSIFHYRILCV